MTISQRPNPDAVEWSIRHNSVKLTKIEAAKAKFRAALLDAIYTVPLGISAGDHDFAVACGDEILMDLFYDAEMRLAEEVADDERILAGSAV